MCAQPGWPGDVAWPKREMGAVMPNTKFFRSASLHALRCQPGVEGVRA